MAVRVIIADDEWISLKMLRKLIDWEGLGLKYCGYAEDGPTLYKLIMGKKPDLVITDIMMPGYDGLKLIAKVQEDGVPVRFLITSAYANFSYAREAMQLGVKDFLEKPVDPDELNRALAKITAQMGDSGEKKQEAEQPQERKTVSVSGQIQAAKDYIDQHYAEKLTLEAVAEHIYLSPNYLSSLFHREMKTSFSEYITEVRMRKAEKLLQNARISVAEAARLVGYRDAAYFCSVFTKKYGISPSAWRRKIPAK